MDHNGVKSRIDAACNSQVRQLKQPREPVMERSLRDRRTAFAGEVAESEGRVTEAQLGRLAEAWSERFEATARRQPAEGLSLFVRGARGPDEVRMVRIRQPVCARPGRPDDGAFLEQKDCVARSGGSEKIADRLGALRVGKGVASTIQHPKVEPVPLGEVDEKLSAGQPTGADLEVRRAWAAHRSSADEGAAKVGATATRSADDSPGGPFQRRAVHVQHARIAEHAQCPLPSSHVQLEPRRLGERTLPVRAQLRAHADVAQ